LSITNSVYQYIVQTAVEFAIIDAPLLLTIVAIFQSALFGNNSGRLDGIGAKRGSDGDAVPDQFVFATPRDRADRGAGSEADTRHRYGNIVFPRNSLLRGVLQNLWKDHHGRIGGKMQIGVVDFSRPILGEHLDRRSRDRCHVACSNDHPRHPHRSEHQHDRGRQNESEFGRGNSLPGAQNSLARRYGFAGNA
jgi:hypothetical protein